MINKYFPDEEVKKDDLYFICYIIDNYNASAYYEPSYVIARAYNNGGF